MRAVRLTAAGGPEALSLEVVDLPGLQPGEASVKVHAAAITRDELGWPVDRLPATPSYELSGVVAAVADDVGTVTVGEAVYALLSFDRDGAAADFVVTAADLLAPKPRTLDDVESAAVPLPGLSAWQALFDHGHLTQGQRVLILGALGGVGHLAVQIAHCARRPCDRDRHARERRGASLARRGRSAGGRRRSDGAGRPGVRHGRRRAFRACGGVRARRRPDGVDRRTAARRHRGRLLRRGAQRRSARGVDALGRSRRAPPADRFGLTSADGRARTRRPRCEHRRCRGAEASIRSGCGGASTPRRRAASAGRERS